MKKLNLLLGMVLALPAVSAQGLPVPDVLGNTIQTLFGGLENVAYQRLILFIGVFTIFYAVLQMSKVFSDSATKKKGISITIALVLGAIATVSMPENLVTAIFTVYSGIMGILLLFGPALYLIYYSYTEINGGTKGGHLARFFILIIISALFMSKTFLSQIGLLETIGAITYIEFFGFVIFIFAIIEMFKAFGNSGKGDPASKPSEPWGDGLTNYFSDRKVRKENESAKRMAEQQKEENERVQKLTKLGRDIAGLELQEENNINLINNLVDALEKAVETPSYKDEQVRVEFLKRLDDAVKTLKKAVENLKINDKSKKNLLNEKDKEILKLITQIEAQIKILNEVNFISEEYKNNLLNEFNNLLQILKRNKDGSANVEEIVKNLSELIDRLVKRTEDLSTIIDNIKKATNNNDAANFARYDSNYRTIISNIKLIVGNLINAIKTIRRGISSEVSNNDILNISNKKRELFNEYNNIEKQVSEYVNKKNELLSQYKQEKSIEGKKEIINKLKELVDNLPEQTSIKSNEKKELEKFIKKYLDSNTNKEEDKKDTSISKKDKNILAFIMTYVNRSDFSEDKLSDNLINILGRKILLLDESNPSKEKLKGLIDIFATSLKEKDSTKKKEIFKEAHEAILEEIKKYNL